MMLRIRGALAIACGLALAGAAGADQGNAVIESKDLSTVVMNGTTYQVGAATVIESKEGARIQLADLPTLAEGASADAAAVWFEADDDERARTAHLIRLTGGMPQ
jgi:hypothetical protein